jgi:hypothetical protein
MNSKHRAELQRKLTLNAVPRPPAGLAERIKADIPNYLEAETVPQRVTRSLAFPMRIAASLMVLAGAVIVAMMVSRGQQEKTASMAEPQIIFAPARRDLPTQDATTTVAVARTEEVQLDIVQEQPAMALPRQIADARMAPPALSQPAFAEEVDSDDAELAVEGEYADGGVASGVVGGRANDSVAEAPAAEPQRRMAEYAPPAEIPAAAPVPPPASAPAPVAPPTVAQMNEALAGAARLERRQDQAAAAKMLSRDREAKRENVFGISTSSQVFDAIRATLESGRRPSASMVDVEALVNYFAGGPARPPRGVRLEVEASPAAIPADGEHAVLRFTIDTPAGSGVAATDARIEVIINHDVVARVQRIGDAQPLTEAVLPHGTSVTGLYALEMKPGLRARDLVATVRLHYKVNGQPDTETGSVYGHDLSKTWQRATRRHRLASLGALWADSLKGGATGRVDVAKRAEELATQEPGDVKARELARAANASAVGGY